MNILAVNGWGMKKRTYWRSVSNALPFNAHSVITSSYRNSSSIEHVSRACLLSILFSFLSLPAAGLAQTQLGGDIENEPSQIESNASVSLSLDGNRLAVGARDNDDNGSRSGHVRVHQWSGTAWEQLGSDIDGEATDDLSGEAVALSADGNRVAIGAINNDGNGEDSGHVRVFQWTGTDWVQLGADIDGEAPGDRSGSAVALSSDGGRLAISAEYNDANGNDTGHVRVYQWSGAAWVQLGADIDGEVEGESFARSISLSGDGTRLAVGAPSSDINGNLSGRVLVYRWSGTEWAPLGAGINGAAVDDFFGRSVSVSSDGNRLAVGANASYYRDGAGIVRVYQWSGITWEQLGTDILGQSNGEASGSSLSLSAYGNRIAIGAPNNSSTVERSGRVRVFQWTGSTWEQLGFDIGSDSIYDYFGKHVSLSADGNRVASATGNFNAIAERINRVRVYDFSLFSAFTINAGLNDAWYFPDTDGQGFFINVFPDIGYVTLAWFTYDTELPPIDATANLGDPGHRWLTALGPIDGNQVLMNVELTSGGIFDTYSEIIRTDPPGSDGTILLTFDSCSTGTIEYDITSINRQGSVPIQRVANDNITLCEALSIP